jgi:hypothetical protein
VIEEDEVNKLKKDQQDEQRIIRDSTARKVKKLLIGKITATRLTDDTRKVLLQKGHELTDADLEKSRRHIGARSRSATKKWRKKSTGSSRRCREQLRPHPHELSRSASSA